MFKGPKRGLVLLRVESSSKTKTKNNCKEFVTKGTKIVRKQILLQKEQKILRKAQKVFANESLKLKVTKPLLMFSQPCALRDLQYHGSKYHETYFLPYQMFPKHERSPIKRSPIAIADHFFAIGSRSAIVTCWKDREAIGDRETNDRDRKKRDLFCDLLAINIGINFSKISQVHPK